MQIGDLVDDRFEIVQAAGFGGMGVVYRAIDRATSNVVAVKLLHTAQNEAVVVRFLREAKTLGDIAHPHVVQYVTHGMTSTGVPYLVMEWLEGTTLAQRLALGRLDVQESVVLVTHIANALAVVHARGIVHRDIKPSNIFLPNGSIERVKLLDFGIAHLGDGVTALTGTGMLLGTPGYMAPEQARGDRSEINFLSDIFSLGCVFFESLTGKPAFQGLHLMALLAKLLLEEPPRVRDLVPEVPAFLDELCASMLAKDPSKRPADVATVLASLDKQEHIDDSASAGFSEVITDAEKRLVSVIAIAVAALTRGTSGTAPTVVSHVPRDLLLEVRRTSRSFGANVEELADGTLVVLLVGANPPTDQAALAARCAIQLQSLLPHAPMVLLTGRGENAARRTVGDAFERAASLLENVQAEWTDRNAGPWIRIDDVTRALLDVRFDVHEKNGRFILRGEQAIGGEARTLLGKPSLFVGRDRELWNLLGIINEGLDESSARAILVTGPAGIGKSRLRHELVTKLRTLRPEIIAGMGRGDSIGSGSAFGMLAAAFRGALGITHGEPIDVQQQRLFAVLNRFVAAQDRKRIGYFLCEMIGVPVADEDETFLKAARQDASVMAAKIETAYIDYVRAVTCVGPAFLVLEDLHWGDVPSLRLIDIALRELHDKPFIVVAFGRPEVETLFPKLWKGRNVDEIRLSPLSRRAAETLSRSVLGESCQAEVVTQIVERAAGNAFYLEELLRAFVENRHDALPDTVLGMVEARLATLPPHGRKVLRAASVYGEVFWQGGVLVLLGAYERDAMLSTLNDLCELELIVVQTQTRFLGEVEYAFRHTLVREAAYAMLTKVDLNLGHRLAGEWLLNGGESNPMVLAEHFDRGNEPLRAGELYTRGVLEAMRGRPVDAVKAGLAGLRALGFSAPDTEEAQRENYGRLLDDIRRQMQIWTVEALAASPVMADPEKRVAMKLARHVALAAFGSETNLGYWLSALSVNLTFTYGRTDESASGVALLGAVLASTTTRFAEAHALVKFALTLHDKVGGSPRESCMLGFYFVTVSHYSIHWRALLPQLQNAFRAGMESGELLFLSYTSSHLSIARFILGEPLELMIEECEHFIALMEKNMLASAAATQTIVKQAIVCLLGRTRSPTSLDDDAFDEAAFTHSVERGGMSFALYWYCTTKGMLLYFAEDPCGAMGPLFRVMGMAALAFTPEARFFTALSILGAANSATQDEVAVRGPILERCLSDLQEWARACPANYLHRYLLVQAENARAQGNADFAAKSYDQAIAAAREHDWPRDEGLASELCAGFHLDAGRESVARAHFVTASRAYTRWGATSLARRSAERAAQAESAQNN